MGRIALGLMFLGGLVAASGLVVLTWEGNLLKPFSHNEGLAAALVIGGVVIFYFGTLVRRRDLVMKNRRPATHMYPVVHEIRNPDGKRRVEVFQRDDGSYGFWDLFWHVEDRAWVPAEGYSEMRADTLQRALLEIRGRVAWVAEAQPNEEL